MKQFIYVVNSKARDEMLEAGFVMLKEEPNGTFIFYNDEDKDIPLSKNDFVLTDILIF